VTPLQVELREFIGVLEWAFEAKPAEVKESSTSPGASRWAKDRAS
jgi:hypothetical protein